MFNILIRRRSAHFRESSRNGRKTLNSKESGNNVQKNFDEDKWEMNLEAFTMK